MWWLVGLAVAFAAGPPTTEAEVVEQLTPRDVPVPCADLAPDATEAARRAALVKVADTVQMPSWVPVRAAGCVAELAPSDALARSAAERWLTDSQTFGLALAVLDRLDDLDEPTADRLAGLAVTRAKREPRFALYVKPVLARSRYPRVRARAVILGK